MPRKQNAERITFEASSEERILLDKYCEKKSRTRTDVLRELVRQLEKKIKDKNDCC